MRRRTRPNGVAELITTQEGTTMARSKKGRATQTSTGRREEAPRDEIKEITWLSSDDDFSLLTTMRNPSSAHRYSTLNDNYLSRSGRRGGRFRGGSESGHRVAGPSAPCSRPASLSPGCRLFTAAASVLFRLLRLFRSVARQVEFDDHAVMHQPIDGRRRRHRILEDRFPARERQVARQ